MDIIPIIPIIAVVLALGWLIGYGMSHVKLNSRIRQTKRQARTYLMNAQEKIHQDEIKIMNKRRREDDDYRSTAEDDINVQNHDNQTRKERLDQRDEYLNQFANRLENNKKRLDQISQVITDKKTAVKQSLLQGQDLLQKRQQVLLLASDLDEETARNIVLDKTRDELSWERDIELKYQASISELNASRNAMNVIITALQRGPRDVPRLHIERNISVPDFEIRNWISGRDDSHLRLLEALTGTDLIFDPDEPLLLHIVTHDPIRREVVRRALNNLIVSRQITTSNIEDQINNAEIEVNDELYETGEHVIKLLHLKPMHPDLMRIIGRLKFRTSYGQNVLYHSIEVGELSGSMAAELGLNTQIARRAGLLHDIGKAIDHEVQGTHVELGVKLAKAFHEDPIIVNTIAAHHGDVDPESLTAILIPTADALSGARPGARSESVEEYVNRLKSLEKIANAQPGVRESYAIQAGRELRIIVNPREVDDNQINRLSANVRNQIESQLSYPGKIKVTTIRKLNAIQYVGYNPHHRNRYPNVG